MRVFNFSAGPAVLPLEVLEQAAAEMCDWQGSGMSVMEMSHRGRQFESIHQQALDDLRELLAVPPDYRVLFMQGGAIAENAIVPMNLFGRRAAADFVVSGLWSVKSHKEAKKYGESRVAASSEASGFRSIPPTGEWQVSRDAAYVHICSNETINGTEYFTLPDADVLRGVPLVADVSSHVLSRPMDVSRYGVMYGGAQKNAGIAGLTFVIAHESLLDCALPICPSAFEWKTVAANNSLFNTPSTYSVYIAGLVFKWLKAQGGLQRIETRNVEKAELLYGAIDASEFYRNDIDRAVRSRMNVPFVLRDESLNAAFLKGAEERGMLQLKGHKAVGGMRASIYNAMPLEGVQTLVDYLRDFERQHG